MVSKKVTLVNDAGFHMRPANMFINAMTKYKSDITIIYNGNVINGKSIMNLMASCIKKGSEIEIRCDGTDEEAMLEEAVELVNSGFGE